MTSTVPGIVTVNARALRSLFAALAAEEFGVPAREVTARVSDSRGRLSVHLDAPMTIAPLGSSRARTVLETAEAARGRIHGDGVALSGITLADVRVRVSGARVVEERRVS